MGEVRRVTRPAAARRRPLSQDPQELERLRVGPLRRVGRRAGSPDRGRGDARARHRRAVAARSEEHTSELQSQSNLACRLLLGRKINNLSPYTRSICASCFFSSEAKEVEYSLALTVRCKSICAVSPSAVSGVAVLLLPPTCSRY